MNFWGHLKTITKHRNKVIYHCFKVGLFFQGLKHDLSKYSFTEFSKGIKYYQGTRSPNEKERELFLSFMSAGIIEDDLQSLSGR